MRTATLVNIIARDTLARPDTSVDLSRCFLCARTFSAGRGFGINARFCSELCLDAYDAGYVHREPGAGYAYPQSGGGFLVDCKSCKRSFVSRGLRCCSPECERQLHERQQIAAVMAEWARRGPATYTGPVNTATETSLAT